MKLNIYYLLFISLAMFTLTYISVPLYKIFCQNYGLGGAVQYNNDVKLALENTLVTNNKYVNF